MSTSSRTVVSRRVAAARVIGLGAAVALAAAPSALGAEVKQVSAGWYHTCALQTGGKPACWGHSGDGRAEPTGGRFKSVSAGEFHSCGLKRSGRVSCWGDDIVGQVSHAPSAELRSVSSGSVHSCGVKPRGKVTCWGYKYDERPKRKARFRSVSAGGSHTCGIKVSGRIACWGIDFHQQVSDAPKGEFRAVSVGTYHTCAVKRNQRAVCWGDDYEDRASPPRMRLKSVSAGGALSCGVKRDKEVACWGPAVAFGPPPLIPFRSVSAGFSHACGVGIGGHVACWGYNQYGQIDVPRELARTTNPRELAKIDGICKRVNDWLADNRFPERLDCGRIPDLKSACYVINKALFEHDGIGANYHCRTGEITP